jgi:putative DNA primase/helicase
LKGGKFELVYIEYENNKKYPKKDADISDNHEAFKNAGWLIKEEDLIVDIDNIPKDIIKKIISLYNIKTQTVWTTRGVHFYFKKPLGFKGAKKVCPLGFEVEYKHLKNTPSVKIKQDGELRIIENEGVREELNPIFFTRKRLESLLGLDESEGRNNALFAHRMKIHDIDNWQSILRFINNNIFASPLPEEEFQTISRDVKIEAQANSEPEVADYLISKYKVVKYLSKIHWYQNDQYLNDPDQLTLMIFEEIGNQRTRYVDEVIKQMLYKAPRIDTNKIFDIKLQNGILRAGEFTEIDYQEFTPYSIDIPFFRDAEPVPIVDEYLNHLTDNDEQYRKRLLEVMAHPLIIDKEFKRMLAKFFIFIGGGGNGKGTLLYVIRQILGAHNSSALSIKQMTDERYFTTMQGKLVNLGDDVQDEAINNEQMKMLKNISTCDYVATRNLFEQSKNIELTISLIFTSNHILKSWEKGESYKRRVDWLPIFSKPKNKDKRFITKLTTPEALQYWVRLIVEGYERLYKNEGFTFSEVVENFNNEYHEQNNTALQYLQDYEKNDFLGLRSPEAYEKYEVWTEENGLSTQSKKLFTQSVFDVFGLSLKSKTINGKTARVFLE